MCDDFSDVNKACLKDSFSLPRIDLLVNSMSKHELLRFMGAYLSYNKIQMSSKDKEHTSFMTNQDTYCYKVMFFGLKNAGATYQRLVNKMFENQISRNMEVYVNDMLVKNVAESSQIRLRSGLRKVPRFYHLPTRDRDLPTRDRDKPREDQGPYGHGSPSEHQGCPATDRMTSSHSRFLVKYGDKYHSFFKALRGTKSTEFQWMTEHQAAFNELKQ
ncbi:hypothetical protein Nepgr_023421 [Nepenthes gracilis]|uniref:Reverse transcriptase domain-containing protein n=1 Tax=Nepenthes gracilis TaxID=150966 RepID=A0AAD3T2T6_NEPGR|nr:hypothetical protein Nepgr_023421 [Nepenthes gracilis]